MPSSLSFYLFSLFSLSSALPWSGALPTNAYEAADWTPVPTTSPQLQNVRRDFFPHNVCGFIGGRSNEPALCSESSSCVWDTVNSVVGCCPIDGPCTVGVYTGCVDRNSPSQTIDNPAIFTCAGESVCYQNSYPGGYRQYGCGTPDLATNVETTFAGQPTSLEVWVVFTSFVTASSTTSSTSSTTSSTTTAPTETGGPSTIVGEIDSMLTTVVGEFSSGIFVVTPTSITPSVPSFFPFTKNSTSTTSTVSIAGVVPPAIFTSSGSSKNSGDVSPPVIKTSSTSSSSSGSNVIPPIILATGTNGDPLSLIPTITASSSSSSFSNLIINPVIPFESGSSSTASSSEFTRTSTQAASDVASSSPISTSSHSLSKKKRNIIIGTTVGVGGALILAIIGIVLFCLRRRRQQQERGTMGETTPMRPTQPDDSYRINFDYPYSPDDVRSPTSPTDREPPVFPPPPNSENNPPAPNLFPFAAFPHPPTTTPSQQQSPNRSAAALTREETRARMARLNTNFDNFHPAVREAISMANSPRKYTPVQTDEAGAFREDSQEVERVRNATRTPRFGESSNAGNFPQRTRSGSWPVPAPGMVNMF